MDEKKICDDICRYFDRNLIDAHVRYEPDMAWSYKAVAELDGYGDVERLGPALLALKAGKERDERGNETVADMLKGSRGQYDFSFSCNNDDCGVWCHFQPRDGSLGLLFGFVPIHDFQRVFGREALTGEMLYKRIRRYLESRGETGSSGSKKFTCKDYLDERRRDKGPVPAGLKELDEAGRDPALLEIYEFSLAAYRERIAYAAELKEHLSAAEKKSD
jgi:hypothetical protein